MRRNVGFALGLVVIIAGFATLWIYLGGERDPAVLTVYEVEGTVQLTTQLGDDVPAADGMRLSKGYRLTTGTDSRVTLAFGEETRVRLGPTSSVEVVSVDETGVKIELEDGMLSATVRPGSGALRIGNNGREVVAEDAVFEVGVFGEAFQARTTEGSLTVVGTDVTRVEAGEQVIAIGRRAVVGPVPEELLLEVTPLANRDVADPIYLVTGTSHPGIRIVVTAEGIDPVQTRTDEKGQFVARIPLIEGQRPTVVVEAFDALGHSILLRPGRLPRLDETGPLGIGGPNYR